MYAFRKPFTAAKYEGSMLWGMDFKTVLVIAQVAGYMISKFIGIKVISEMPPHRRATGLLLLIALAEGALVAFGILPRPWNAACLFLNGLPLGMVYGLVVGYLEGRRLTEALVAGLCASFILADGVTKSVGSWLLEQGIAEDWMPSAAGAVFAVPLLVCVAMLARIRPPGDRDIAARAERLTMSRGDRWTFLMRHAVGLLPLLVVFLLVTVLRSFRADFAPEIWHDLGHDRQPGIFTQSETLVALGVMIINGASVLISDNRRAYCASLATCGLGFVMLVAALVARHYQIIGSFNFMVLIGLGLYLPYVAMHSTVFERFLAMTRDRGNLGFLMYVADALGYLGYVGVMVARNFIKARGDFVGLLATTCWIAVGVSLVCLMVSWRHFSTPITTNSSPATTPGVP
ncbi:MAG: hypothetical protein HY290_15335 [Planctomycetia bacterium]|nr:hypothetical protein [Planctomycetia bacterium]